jgi:hypothetical protein
MIKKVHYNLWSKFQPHLSPGPCCNPAFPQGECFGLFENAGSQNITSMIWYTFCFRQSSQRRKAIPEFGTLSQPDQMIWLHKNIRLLARISTLPEYRHRGFAHKLVSETIELLNVPYVECLTVWPDVRHLLSDLNFIKMDNNIVNSIDYWLWTKKPA